MLGFLGSFYAYEGLDLLIKALVQIRQTLPDTCLLLVGGGPQQQALQQLVQQLKLEEAVIMPGRVPHQEVMKYYSLVDLLVYPRKAMRLTELVTPLKPLEAMAMGKALVLSDVAPHYDFAVDPSGPARALPCVYPPCKRAEKFVLQSDGSVRVSCKPRIHQTSPPGNKA